MKKLRNKKTGEIGELQITEKHYAVVVGNGTANCNAKIYCSLTELNEEWEDYEEPKEYYWYIDDLDIVSIDRVQSSTIAMRKNFGNYFETKEEAEKAVEKLKAWKRLKDKNFHFLKYSALGYGEIDFSLDFEDMDDEGEIGELRHDLDLLFGGEE